jgi:hypothetical protein
MVANDSKADMKKASIHALSSRFFFHLGIRVATIALTIAVKKKITVNVSLFWQTLEQVLQKASRKDSLEGRMLIPSS